MKHHSLSRRLMVAAGITAASAMALVGCSTPSGNPSGGSSGSSDIVIGFSQSFSSNSFQAANDKAAQTAADVLKGDGKIKDFVYADANNDVNTQISQINSMILQGVNVLMVDPTSSTALNGTLEKAVSAGIPVLVFTDGPVTSTAVYDMEAPLAEYNGELAQYIVDQLHGKGNVLNVRGVAGTGADDLEWSGAKAVFDANPGIKIVGTVYGGWDEAPAQSEVAKALPGLPQIDAVMQQGGSGYGIAQAFAAAGRPAPIIVMGNRGEELQWWAQQSAAGDYTTTSISPNPGMGAAAVYISYALATGQTVPKKMVMPNLTITQDDLSKYSDLKSGDVAYEVHDQQWVQDNIIAKGTN